MPELTQEELLFCNITNNVQAKIQILQTPTP